MKTIMVTVFVCSMAACALDESDQRDDELVMDDEQSVIGGTVDTGDPCVVAVFAHPPGSGSGSLCTGTVIGARTVLTAAHCVSPAFIPAGWVFEILSGTTLTLPGIVASSTTFDSAFNPSNLWAGHDIGIVHTTNALPFPVCGRTAVSFILPARVVGYGSDTHTNTGAGTKRTVTTNIVAASSVLIQVGNSNMQSCHGDSGGPVFQTIGGLETVVAVTSFGSDSPPQVCFGGGFHNRVDAHAAYINANTF